MATLLKHQRPCLPVSLRLDSSEASSAADILASASNNLDCADLQSSLATANISDAYMYIFIIIIMIMAILIIVISHHHHVVITVIFVTIMQRYIILQ